MGGPLPRQACWHELLSKVDLHVVYTPGPVNPVGDFLSRWAYSANPALGDVSIHGTAQVDRDVPDMVAAEKEELLARPLVFRAIVARVVTRSRSKTAPEANRAPACDTPPQAWAPVGGGTEQKKKLPKAGASCQETKVLEVPQEGNTYTWGGCSQRFRDKLG